MAILPNGRPPDPGPGVSPPAPPGPASEKRRKREPGKSGGKDQERRKRKDPTPRGSNPMPARPARRGFFRSVTLFIVASEGFRRTPCDPSPLHRPGLVPPGPAESVIARHAPNGLS